MNKKLLKGLVSLAFLAILFVPAATFAINNLDELGYGYINNDIALGNRDPREMVAQIINVAMLFLGIIAVVIVLLGGFKWMTAAGNEDKVSEAKKLLGAGVIGLVIILAAWGITTFILNSLINATQ
jgi:heme/copper-type cytochrome/quinol oxidase subunit 2